MIVLTVATLVAEQSKVPVPLCGAVVHRHTNPCLCLTSDCDLHDNQRSELQKLYWKRHINKL